MGAFKGECGLLGAGTCTRLQKGERRDRCPNTRASATLQPSHTTQRSSPLHPHTSLSPFPERHQQAHGRRDPPSRSVDAETSSNVLAPSLPNPGTAAALCPGAPVLTLASRAPGPAPAPAAPLAGEGYTARAAVGDWWGWAAPPSPSRETPLGSPRPLPDSTAVEGGRKAGSVSGSRPAWAYTVHSPWEGCREGRQRWVCGNWRQGGEEGGGQVHKGQDGSGSGSVRGGPAVCCERRRPAGMACTTLHGTARHVAAQQPHPSASRASQCTRHQPLTPLRQLFPLVPPAHAATQQPLQHHQGPHHHPHHPHLTWGSEKVSATLRMGSETAGSRFWSPR